VWPVDLAQCSPGHVRDDVIELGFTEEPSSGGPTERGRLAKVGPPFNGINRPRLVQIVAYAGFRAYLGWVAGLFEFLAPANALPSLTKMPCRWHCERQLQGDGIHRHAAGNVLHSLVSSLPIGPSPFFSPVGNSRLYLIFVATQGGLLPCQINATKFALALIGISLRLRSCAFTQSPRPPN
jgi:hypothetical protein